MRLTEDTQVPLAALPVDHFKDHLRLSTGFETDTVQDDLLESFLRAALVAIEARTGKALLERQFRWEVTFWRDDCGAVLPISPVSSLTSAARIDRFTVETPFSVNDLRVEPDLHSPVLRPQSALLPTIPRGGLFRLIFVAGFGPAWSDIPPDLAQAVLLLASHYYEYRHETALAGGCVPFGVTALIERYRPVRLGLGER